LAQPGTRLDAGGRVGTKISKHDAVALVLQSDAAEVSMSSSSRWFIPLAAFCLASVINPGYFAGCTSATGGPEAEQFAFGEADMLELVDEANVTSPFEITSGSTRYRLEVSFEQRSGDDQDDTTALAQPLFASRTFACGTRTFMQSAAACITMSEVLLTATINLYRIDGDGLTQVVHDRTLDARLWVGGTKLTNAQIESGSYGVGSSTTRLSLTSSNGQTFKLAQFRIVDSDLLIEANKQ
jgi:hypothetical protein